VLADLFKKTYLVAKCRRSLINYGIVDGEMELIFGDTFSGKLYRLAFSRGSWKICSC
jgi:hypothetical protein